MDEDVYEESGDVDADGDVPACDIMVSYTSCGEMCYTQEYVEELQAVEQAMHDVHNALIQFVQVPGNESFLPAVYVVDAAAEFSAFAYGPYGPLRLKSTGCVHARCEENARIAASLVTSQAMLSASPLHLAFRHTLFHAYRATRRAILYVYPFLTDSLRMTAHSIFDAFTVVIDARERDVFTFDDPHDQHRHIPLAAIV